MNMLKVHICTDCKSKTTCQLSFIKLNPFQVEFRSRCKAPSQSPVQNIEPCLAYTNIVWTTEGAQSLKEEKDFGVRALREVLGEGGQSILLSKYQHFISYFIISLKLDFRLRTLDWID